MAISGRFVVLLLVGAIPIVLIGEPWVLGAWLVLVISVGLIDLARAVSPRKVILHRELPSRVRLGETAPTELFVTNTGHRMLRSIIRDGWEPSAGAAVSRSRVRVPAGERRVVSVPLTPFRRGERRANHVTIRSFGPLGMWARQATIAHAGSIRVLPPFTARKHLPSRLVRLHELDGLTAVMVRGQGTEFDSLREYVRGDDVRSIDWRATARRNDVVVRTWRPERDRRVVILIDSGRTSAARVDNEPRIDTAFESALLLAALATRAGDRVDTIVYDRRVRARISGNGADILSRMVDSMADVEPELIEADWAAVPAQVRQASSQRALVVLLTSIDTVGAARGLLSVLPQLTRKHTVLVASVTDPAMLAATSQRTDRDGVYRAAAAERSLLDVARVSAAVRQLGAHVVTGSPADLPPAVADRYIALKAAGRL